MKLFGVTASMVLLGACGPSDAEIAAAIKQGESSKAAYAAAEKQKLVDETAELAPKPPEAVAMLAKIRARATAIVAAFPDDAALKAVKACAKGKPPGARTPSLVLDLDALQFLATEEPHFLDKGKEQVETSTSTWHLGAAADLEPWVTYERYRRHDAGRPADARNPRSLHERRVELARDVAAPIDAPLFIAQLDWRGMEDLDKGRRNVRLVAIDAANKPICRIDVKSEPRIEYVTLSGNGPTAAAVATEELRWQMQLAIDKTTLPMRAMTEVHDPAADAIDLSKMPSSRR